MKLPRVRAGMDMASPQHQHEAGQANDDLSCKDHKHEKNQLFDEVTRNPGGYLGQVEHGLSLRGTGVDWMYGGARCACRLFDREAATVRLDGRGLLGRRGGGWRCARWLEQLGR